MNVRSIRSPETRLQSSRNQKDLQCNGVQTRPWAMLTQWDTSGTGICHTDLQTMHSVRSLCSPLLKIVAQKIKANGHYVGRYDTGHSVPATCLKFLTLSPTTRVYLCRLVCSQSIVFCTGCKRNIASNVVSHAAPVLQPLLCVTQCHKGSAT